MLRLLWTLIQICLVLALIAYLGQFNSPVEIRWDGILIELSLMTLSVGLAIVFSILIFCILSVSKLRRVPKNFKDYRYKRRREKGYRALTRGMVAVAAGEKFAARKAAKQAEVLLQDPPLTMLLSAQSAQLDGDEMAAKRYFNKMLDHPEMAFLGWRGLIMQSLQQNDRAATRDLISQAEARFPKQPWLVTQSLELEEIEGNSGKALTLVHRAQKTGALTKTEALDHEARLLIQQSRESFAGSRWQEAQTTAIKAGKVIKKQSTQANPIMVYEQQLLLADCALRLKDESGAKKALQQCWNANINSKEVLHRLEAMNQDNDYDAFAQWKFAKLFFKDSTLDSFGAIWLARVALKAGLIGEAEAVLSRDPKPESLGHYQLRVQIAEQQENAESIHHWQQKVLEL